MSIKCFIFHKCFKQVVYILHWNKHLCLNILTLGTMWFTQNTYLYLRCNITFRNLSSKVTQRTTIGSSCKKWTEESPVTVFISVVKLYTNVKHIYFFNKSRKVWFIENLVQLSLKLLFFTLDKKLFMITVKGILWSTILSSLNCFTAQGTTAEALPP